MSTISVSNVTTSKISSTGSDSLTISTGNTSGPTITLSTNALAFAGGYTPIQLISTEAAADAGPILELYRNSASPAANDILGQVLFTGEDSAGNKQEYASIETSIVDPTSTSEDGSLDFYTTIAGVRARVLSLGPTAAVSPGTNDAASLGFSGVAWSDVFLASGGVVNWAAGDTTLTQTTGNLALAGSATDVVLDISAANAGQIKFPATQNPSAGANTLDDYEEGTWTPTLAAGSGTFTSASATGKYTKIGRLVTFAVRVSITTNGTAAGSTTFTLPFTADGSSQYAVSGREQAATGFGVSGAINSPTTILFQKYDGAYLGADGYVIDLSGFFYV